MTHLVQHDISVVPVFDLQQKSDDAISGHGLDEVSPRCLEILGCFIAVHLQKVLVHPDIGLPAKLVPRLSIRNTFDDAVLKQKSLVSASVFKLYDCTK